jgi:hypothetical protein
LKLENQVLGPAATGNNLRTQSLEAELKVCAEALQRLWDEDEMGFLHGDGIVECGTCGNSAAGVSVINHENWCVQAYIGNALSQPITKSLLENAEASKS